jgi:hypothetical protein
LVVSQLYPNYRVHIYVLHTRELIISLGR